MDIINVFQIHLKKSIEFIILQSKNAIIIVNYRK